MPQNQVNLAIEKIYIWYIIFRSANLIFGGAK